MSQESRVKDENGTTTHVRSTSDDGKTSYLYEVGTFGGRTCVEIAEHHKDGTTDAYKPGGILDALFHGGKGEHK